MPVFQSMNSQQATEKSIPIPKWAHAKATNQTHLRDHHLPHRETLPDQNSGAQSSSAVEPFPHDILQAAISASRGSIEDVAAGARIFRRAPDSSSVQHLPPARSDFENKEVAQSYVKILDQMSQSFKLLTLRMHAWEFRLKRLDRFLQDFQNKANSEASHPELQDKFQMPAPVDPELLKVAEERVSAQLRGVHKDHAERILGLQQASYDLGSRLQRALKAKPHDSRSEQMPAKGSGVEISHCFF